MEGEQFVSARKYVGLEAVRIKEDLHSSSEEVEPAAEGYRWGGCGCSSGWTGNEDAEDIADFIQEPTARLRQEG